MGGVIGGIAKGVGYGVEAMMGPGIAGNMAALGVETITGQPVDTSLGIAKGIDKDLIFKGNDGGSTITALTLDMSAAGAATFNNDVTAFSDERLKTDIKTIDNALSKVCDMRGVYFNRDGAAGTGVIAQEIQNILPEVVHDKQEYLSVAYGNMVGVLIEAIKELKKEVETLKESK